MHSIHLPKAKNSFATPAAELLTLVLENGPGNVTYHITSVWTDFIVFAKYVEKRKCKNAPLAFFVYDVFLSLYIIIFYVVDRLHKKGN